MSRTRADHGPRRFAIHHDGLRIAGLDWGGDGLPLLFLHPTGFCAGFFDPLARRLVGPFRPVGVDLRGHGATDVPGGPDDYVYGRMADDVVAVLDHLGIDELVVLGESLGGGVGTLVDAVRPGAVLRLMLCEAIVFDLDRDPVRTADRPGGPNSMASIARRRRAVWPDRATVLTSYGSRPPLDALAPEALAAYVRWGFVDRRDGQVELACPPEAEAMVFEAAELEQSAASAFRHLGSVTAAVSVLHGDRSELPGDWFRAQAEHSGARLELVPGGHLFLHEDTDRAERLVLDHLLA